MNTDYQGEINNQGDVVKIRQIPSITIRDYSKHSTLIHERPIESVVDFPIEKAKYFDFICDDIDKHQTDIDVMNVFSDDAGMQMKIAIDTNILANVYSDADSTNAGATAGAKSGDINLGVTGTPLVLTKADILDVVVDCGTCLTENNVPETQRSLVIPAWFASMVLKSDQLVPCVGNSTVHNQVNCWNPEMGISTQASNEEGSTTTDHFKYAKAA